MSVIVRYCPHIAWSGAERPILLMGRWPVLWECDECGWLEAQA